MKRALIGVSSPLGYSYRNDIETEFGQPNPIIDSPLGIFLFYDEIWFLNRRTCPINCHNLPYVKFVDEEYDLTKLDLDQFNWRNLEIQNYLHRETTGIDFETFRNSVSLNMAGREDGIDNHGRPFMLGKLQTSPNPTPENLIVDDYIASKLGFELITNSITEQYALLTRSLENPDERILTQHLICENIPNFQLELGPYHELIEDLRSESLIKSFREKLAGKLDERDSKSIEQLKIELEKEMNDYLLRLIIKHVDKNRIYKGTSSAIFGQIPILSNVYSGIEGGMEVYNGIKDKKKVGWMGFLAKAKMKFD